MSTQPLKHNDVAGVKVEPKILREQTRLEQITSLATHLGTTITKTLPKRRSVPNAPSFPLGSNGFTTTHFSPPAHTGQAYAAPPFKDAPKKKERATFASFDSIEVAGPRGDPVRLQTLNIGYPSGFQLWDITNPDNVHELCSVRNEDQLTNVRTIVALPRVEAAINASVQQIDYDQLEASTPLLAIIAETILPGSCDSTIPPTPPPDDDCDPPLSINDLSSETTETANPANRRPVLQLYSLQKQAIVKTVRLGEKGSEVVDVKANGRVVVVATTNPLALHILSPTTFAPLRSPITDISTTVPIFALGPRLFAYASTSIPQAPLDKDHHNNGGTSGLASLIPGYGTADPGESIKVAREVLGGVASGVRSLGEFGYATLAGYIAAYNGAASSPPHVSPHHVFSGTGIPVKQTVTPSPIAFSGSPRASHSSSHSPSPHSPLRKQVHTVAGTEPTSPNDSTGGRHDGVIAIRDISTGNMVTCFRSHASPIKGILFSPTGAHVLTTTTNGQTFHIHGLQPNPTPTTRRSPTCTSQHVGSTSQQLLYRLTRGITTAEIESFDFSSDGLWCSVSTARGTTHVFPVHPVGPTSSAQGAAAEIAEHVYGRVGNVAPMGGAGGASTASNITAIIRIKQRKGMPDAAAGAKDESDDIAVTGFNPNYSYQGFSPSPPCHGSTNFDSTYYANPTKDGITPPRARLVTSFLSRSARNPYLFQSSAPPAGIFGVGAAVAGQGLAAAAGTLKGVAGKIGSWATASSSGNHINGAKSATVAPLRVAPATLDHERVFNFDADEEDFYDSLHSSSPPSAGSSHAPQLPSGHRDVYTFHPAGALTLHRIWVGLHTIARKDERGRVRERVEMVAGCEDVAEWKVARAVGWTEVRTPMEPPTSRRRAAVAASAAAHHRTWLAQAEIQTYPVAGGEPLWSSSQFGFQVFEGRREDVENCLKAGKVPDVKKVVVRKKTPEPYGVKGVRAILGEQEGEDAIAVLEESLNTAMETSLSRTKSQAARLIAQQHIPLPCGPTLSFENADLIDIDPLDVSIPSMDSFITDIDRAPPTPPNSKRNGKKTKSRKAPKVEVSDEWNLDYLTVDDVDDADVDDESDVGDVSDVSDVGDVGDLDILDGRDYVLDIEEGTFVGGM